MKNCFYFLLIMAISITACKKDADQSRRDNDLTTFDQPAITDQRIELNPSGYAPLSAYINIETAVKTKARVRVLGKNQDYDVVKNFDSASSTHRLPVLGLYGAYDNIVELTLFDAFGFNLGTSSVVIRTDSLISDLPAITIDVPSPAGAQQMTLVSYFGFDTHQSPNRPFVFDDAGEIRWYLDYKNHPVLYKLAFHNGMELLANGNLYFGDVATNAIYEIDFFGNIIHSWPLNATGYRFHHQVLEKPDGNFLLTADKEGISTIEDHIIEVDRTSGQVVRTWDLRQSLQYNRVTTGYTTNDWLHLNALEYDAADNSIIASGRVQGMVKLDANNNVKWIMAPHKGWGVAGNGVDLNTKLLQPIGATNNMITDPYVLNGNSSHPDFEWNWYQHAPVIMPDGDILLFDNGDDRNYGASPNYSRAVKYKVDGTAMTIKQQWQYGKERGEVAYSRIVSDVDFDKNTNRIIFSSGAVGPYGKIIEIEYNTSNVAFEASIFPPSHFGITFHRTERIKL